MQQLSARPLGECGMKQQGGQPSGTNTKLKKCKIVSCIVIQQFGKLVIFYKKILCFERERDKMVATFLELP